MTVLDVSNYDADTFDVACLKAAGVDRVIVGCQLPLVAREMVTKAQAGGIEVMGVYAYLYFGLDTLRQTQNAVQVAREFHVPTVWLDCESTGADQEANGVTPEQRIAYLLTCVQMVETAGLKCGIYTGSWWWPGRMNNTDRFSHLPLWHAEYPADGHEVREVGYGGWSKVAIHQYTSGLNLCGRDRDANYVFEEDDMTPDEVAAIAAGQFLPLLAQAIGADVSTFSDQATVDRIREALQAMAKGGATPRLVYADIGRQIEQAGKAIQAAGNARTLGGAIS